MEFKIRRDPESYPPNFYTRILTPQIHTPWILPRAWSPYIVEFTHYVNRVLQKLLKTMVLKSQTELYKILITGKKINSKK